MIVELRQKSQITLPTKIVKSLNLNVGDQLEIIEKDGQIYLIPVVTYPKKYLKEIKEEIKKTEKEIKEGKRKSFSNLKDLFKDLDK